MYIESSIMKVSATLEEELTNDVAMIQDKIKEVTRQLNEHNEKGVKPEDLETVKSEVLAKLDEETQRTRGIEEKVNESVNERIAMLGKENERLDQLLEAGKVKEEDMDKQVSELREKLEKLTQDSKEEMDSSAEKIKVLNLGYVEVEHKINGMLERREVDLKERLVVEKSIEDDVSELRKAVEKSIEELKEREEKERVLSEQLKKIERAQADSETKVEAMRITTQISGLEEKLEKLAQDNKEEMDNSAENIRVLRLSYSEVENKINEMLESRGEDLKERSAMEKSFEDAMNELRKIVDNNTEVLKEREEKERIVSEQLSEIEKTQAGSGTKIESLVKELSEAGAQAKAIEEKLTRESDGVREMMNVLWSKLREEVAEKENLTKNKIEALEQSHETESRNLESYKQAAGEELTELKNSLLEKIDGLGKYNCC